MNRIQGVVTTIALTVCAYFGPSARSARADCNQYTNYAFPNGSYLIDNDAWDDSPGQCIDVFSNGAFTVTQNAYLTMNPGQTSGPLGYGYILGFPHTMQGQSFGEGPTASSGMPIQVSAINSWPLTWTISGTNASGAWDAAVEFWATTYNPNDAGACSGAPGGQCSGGKVNQADGTELMIRLSQQNTGPGGLPLSGTANIGGIDWDIYAGKWPSNQPNAPVHWNFINYVPHQGNITTISADFAQFFTNAEIVSGGSPEPLGPCTNGTQTQPGFCTYPNWYVTSVQAGFEIFNGTGDGVGLTSDEFQSTPNAQLCGYTIVGQTLTQGQSVTSCNGQYVLVVQSDGNVVEYQGSQPLWATGPGGAGSYLRMQADGNLVEFNSSGTPIWNSGTISPGAYFRVQDDGNVVEYSVDNVALWSAEGELASGGEIVQGGWTRSYDGQYQLSMQGDGNLVLYFGSQPLWATGTSTGAVVRMGGDGNLVVYDANNSPIWSSGTAGNPGAYLAVTNDGHVIIYSASNSPLWSRP